MLYLVSSTLVTFSTVRDVMKALLDMKVYSAVK